MDNFNNKPMTKRERRLLKKQQQAQERMRLARRKKLKKALFVFLPIILIVGGIVFILSNNLSNNQSQKDQGTAKIEISQKEYDAGTVSMADGLVKHTYEIKNTGDGDLEIKDIKTSCMCTTAILKVGDKKSPKFGMHNNPVFWSQKIAPAETGHLEVIFDPAFHGPQGIGQAVRFVSFSTNDPNNKKAKVKLLANVVR